MIFSVNNYKIQYYLLRKDGLSNEDDAMNKSCHCWKILNHLIRIHHADKSFNC